MSSRYSDEFSLGAREGGARMSFREITKNRAEPLLPLKELFSVRHDEAPSNELFGKSTHENGRA